MLQLNGQNIPTTFNADGSLTGTVAASDGFFITAPVSLTTTGANAGKTEEREAVSL